MVGSTGRDRSRLGENMNSPILQETVGNRPPVRRNAEKPRLVVASIVVLTIAAFPALAQAKKARAQCVDRPQQFSWSFILPGQPAPRPNGCSPPVYNYGKFIGQDPDPNIRLQLMRDPATGYSPL